MGKLIGGKGLGIYYIVGIIAVICMIGLLVIFFLGMSGVIDGDSKQDTPNNSNHAM